MQVTETKLRCDKTIEALFLSSSQSDLGVTFGEYDKSILSTCAHELIEKLVNVCEKKLGGHEKTVQPACSGQEHRCYIESA